MLDLFYELAMPPAARPHRSASSRRLPGGDRARRPARLPRRVAGRAPFHARLLAFLQAGAHPRRAGAAHVAPAARTGRRAPAVPSSGPCRRARRHARPSLWRPSRGRHRSRLLAAGVCRVRRRDGGKPQPGRRIAGHPARCGAGRSRHLRGRHFRLDAVTIVPRPVQQPYPPLWIGSGQPRHVRLGRARGPGRSGRALQAVADGRGGHSPAIVRHGAARSPRASA